MARRVKKKHVDAELLKTIFILENEWKQIRALGQKSIDRTLESREAEKIAEAK